MVIEELAKPAGAWCPHCAPGKGCGIYNAHPQSCRQFACQWLSNAAVPDALKPDRSKIVLTLEANGRRLVAHVDPGAPMAWRRGPAFSYLKAQAAIGWGRGHVLVRLVDEMWLVTPTDILGLGAIAPGTPFRIEGPPGDLRLSLLDGDEVRVMKLSRSRS
jgi:hypothetical protein